MKFQMMFKVLSIFVISIGLLVALGSIEYKVSERGQYRSNAKSSIATGWSGPQLVASPLLRLELRKHYDEEVFDKNLKKYVTKKRSRTWEEWHLPDELTIDSSVSMQERYLGIYEVPVYETEFTLVGAFIKPIAMKKGVEIKRAELITSFEDMRGISNTPTINWNNNEVDFKPGESAQLLGNYISANILNLNPTAAGKFTMSAKLRGMDAIRFSPLAKQVKTTLTADWPHPYFEGRYLPVHREISENGFTARWEMTEFATSIQSSIKQCKNAASECSHILRQNSFGVGLHNPIDVYQKTDRSLKYGFLFIALTFIAFLLFEVIKRIAIHPVQYTLVGSALAIFYLLLISLSEHISFVNAYIIAALACVSLIGFYLSYVLKNKVQALLMSVCMGLLYAMLYMILRSEDFALLMGAILTFIFLGSLMVVTRKIDWYELSRSATKKVDLPSSDDASLQT